MLQLLFLYAISTFPLSCLLAKAYPPFFLIAVRMGIAGLLLITYLLVWRRSAITFAKNHIFLYLQLILCAGILPYFLRFWALGHASPSRMAFWFALTPLVGYGMSCLLGTSRATWPKAAALCIGFIGIILTSLVSSAGLPVPSFSYGDMACLTSIVLFTYGWLLIQKMLTIYNYSIVFLNALIMLGTGTFAAGFSFYYEKTVSIADVQTIALPLLFIILVSNVVAHNLYGYLLTRYSLTVLQLGVWGSPILYNVIMQQISLAQTLILLGVSFVLLLCYLNSRFSSLHKTILK